MRFASVNVPSVSSKLKFSRTYVEARYFLRVFDEKRENKATFFVIEG